MSNNTQGIWRRRRGAAHHINETFERGVGAAPLKFASVFYNDRLNNDITDHITVDSSRLAVNFNVEV